MQGTHAGEASWLLRQTRYMISFSFPMQANPPKIRVKKVILKSAVNP